MKKLYIPILFEPLRRITKRSRISLLLLGLSVPLTAWSLSLSDYLNESTVTASSSQFETNMSNNTSTVQITPNAELIVVKQVINDHGGVASLADFSVASSAGTLNFDAGVTAGSTTTFTSDTVYVPPGTYTLTELDFAGYTEGSWSCTVGTVGSDTFDSGAVTLAFGEQTVCTIINDDIEPTLTLAKTVTNDNGGILTDADFSLSVDAAVVSSGVANPVLANTALTISELDVDGYTEGTWACTDVNGLTTGLPTAGLATSTTVNLLPGSDVTCAISNDDIAPTLTLTKTLVNDDGGDLTIADFDISVDSVEVVNGAINTVAANSAILISELDIPGYTEGIWSCTDSTGLTTVLPSAGVATGETITLASGAVVECVITNDDVAPTLTLVKTVVNDNGGTEAIEDFDISIDGTEVVSGTPTTVTANTLITISELDLVPYAEGTWACSDANSLTTGLPSAGTATGTDISLLPGSAVTCSITNNDLGIDLTIAKSVDDATPNIGQTITFTLVVSNAGPDVATNVTVTDPVPAGFSYVGSSMGGGDATDDTDPTGAGLTWTINSIPVGSPVSLMLQATVNAP